MRQQQAPILCLPERRRRMHSGVVGRAGFDWLAPLPACPMQALSHRVLLASMTAVARSPWLEHICVLSVSTLGAGRSRSCREAVGCVALVDDCCTSCHWFRLPHGPRG